MLHLESGVMLAHAEHVVLADLLGSLPAFIESSVYTCQSSKFMITARPSYLEEGLGMRPDRPMFANMSLSLG